jgi:preprotein translocase subunit SecE
MVLLGFVAVLVGLGVWLVKSGKWAQWVAFVGEVRTELKKVSFPSRDEVVGTTIVVIVTSFIFAIYLFAADQLIVWAYTAIVRVLS